MRYWQIQLVVITLLAFVMGATSSHAAPAAEQVCDGKFKVFVKADATDEFVNSKREALEAMGTFEEYEACEEALRPLIEDVPESSIKSMEESIHCDCDGTPKQAKEEAPAPPAPTPTDNSKAENPKADQQAQVAPEPESCGCDATGAGVWTWALLFPWMRRRRK